MLSFQKRNQTLGSFFVLCNDILNAAAQGRFNGGFILFFRLDDIRHHADDTGHRCLLLHHTLDASAVPFVSLCQIGQSVQSGFFGMIACLRRPKLCVIRSQFLLHPRNLRFIILLLLIKRGNLGRHRFKGFPVFQNSLRLFLLHRLRLHQPARQFRLSNLSLLRFRLQRTLPGLDLRPFTQKGQKSALFFFDLFR